METNQENDGNQRELSENFVELGSLLAYKSFIRTAKSVPAPKAIFHMLIQCPGCDRRGNIPDRFGLAPHKVRCRTCDARFWTVPPSAKEEISRRAMPIGESPNTRVAGDLAPFPYLPVSVGLDDDDDSTLDALGPGDSHYELTVTYDDESDDSQIEIRAFASGEAPSSDEIAVLAEDPSSAEILIADPRHFNLVDPGSRYRFAIMLTMGLLTLAMLGFLVRYRILSAQPVRSSITALFAGCIGLGGVLVVLFSMNRSPRLFFLGELAKNLRRSSPRSKIDSQVASE
jgi:hypothetical protein